MSLDALIIATSPAAKTSVAGISLLERAIRSARRVGAVRVVVVEKSGAPQLRELAGAAQVLVIRADQMVHPPLLQPMLALLDAGTNDAVIAVAPAAPVATDVAPGDYAGALVVRGDDVARVLQQFSDGRDDVAVAQTLRAAGAGLAPHGEIARHPVATPADRAAAHRLLYRILVKPQDNVITKYLYRPISFPLTVMFSKTPITPNQISYITAVLVTIGCYLSAQASMNAAIAGTAVILAASYVDCCDGEIARLKLLSSRWGAWLDTIIDEFSSVGYMIAIGWHCHQYFGPDFFGQGLRVAGLDLWTVAIMVSTVTYLVSIYCVYFNIIVVVGSANSQDYVGEFEVMPGAGVDEVRLQPAATQAIAADHLPAPIKFLATYLPYIIRRDFICWAALGLAVAHLTHVAFAALVIGGAVTAVIVLRDHIKLRLQLGRIRVQGKKLIREG
ncbi:MAG: CDP-alcohol phosphatidyltransferase family protein [Kofleriaceae bacterium]|nr:CDP-alcohol phosphatidyltransferase family protein [Kofleriaceae bacterium]